MPSHSPYDVPRPPRHVLEFTLWFLFNPKALSRWHREQHIGKITRWYLLFSPVMLGSTLLLLLTFNLLMVWLDLPYWLLGIFSRAYYEVFTTPETFWGQVWFCTEAGLPYLLKWFIPTWIIGLLVSTESQNSAANQSQDTKLERRDNQTKNHEPPQILQPRQEKLADTGFFEYLHMMMGMNWGAAIAAVWPPYVDVILTVVLTISIATALSSSEGQPLLIHEVQNPERATRVDLIVLNYGGIIALAALLGAGCGWVVQWLTPFEDAVLAGAVIGGLAFVVMYFFVFGLVGLPLLLMQHLIKPSLEYNPYLFSDKIWFPLPIMERHLIAQARKFPWQGVMFCRFLRQHRPLQRTLADQINRAIPQQYFQYSRNPRP